MKENFVSYQLFSQEKIFGLQKISIYPE